MGYNIFKDFGQTLKNLGLQEQTTNLFDKIKTVSTSNWLKQSLELATIMPVLNERAKQERLISPLLLEVLKVFQNEISLYSGEELNVRPEENLSGFCDFFLTLHSPKRVMEAPIFLVINVAKSDLDEAMSKCAAQMFAAQIFNQTQGKEISAIYGCAVNGKEWQFLKLENQTLTLNKRIYFQSELHFVLGVFHHIISLVRS